MTAEVANGVVQALSAQVNGNINPKNSNIIQTSKKLSQTECRWRRRKQKKNKSDDEEDTNDESAAFDDGGALIGNDSAKENSDLQKVRKTKRAGVDQGIFEDIAIRSVPQSYT